MKITLDDNKIVFTSDLHLNHRKLCTSYEDHFDRTRKYATIDEMNADIEKQWNDVVDDETTVFFLGDFTLGTPGSKLVDLFREYYNKLHFKHMYWLLGNHDYEIFKKLSKVIVLATISVFSERCILHLVRQRFLIFSKSASALYPFEEVPF